MPADNVSGYAAYERGGVLARVVLVNLDAWLASQEAAGAVRPNVTVDLGLVFGANANATSTANATSSADSNTNTDEEDANTDALRHATVHVARLGVAHADDVSGLTWAGQSYEASADASPTGARAVETLQVGADGRVRVTLRASEAVLVSFGA